MWGEVAASELTGLDTLCKFQTVSADHVVRSIDLAALTRTDVPTRVTVRVVCKGSETYSLLG